MQIQIDSELFKLQDGQVALLIHGAISIERFALGITEYSPYILIGNTIYALTEDEYYALMPMRYTDTLTTEAFDWVLANAPVDKMADKDCAALQRIKDNVATCSSCTYKRYKAAVSNMVHRYNMELPAELDVKPELKTENYTYPEVTAPVVSKVSALLDFSVDMLPPERRACMDCVEKHVSQARILGKEALMGYPAHLVYACGHLEEAVAECPVEAKALRDTLVFLIAKAKTEKKLTLPLPLLLPLIADAREKLINGAPIDSADDNAAQAFELALTKEMQDELLALPAAHKTLLAQRLRAAEAADSALDWEGAMACAADEIVELAPSTANMLRNRRLLFVSNPALMRQSGFPLSELIQYL